MKTIDHCFICGASDGEPCAGHVKTPEEIAAEMVPDGGWAIDDGSEFVSIRHSDLRDAHRTARGIIERLVQRIRRDERRDDTPWPVDEILRVLADAADHLLNVHDCDCHDHEQIIIARDVARQILAERVPARREPDPQAGHSPGVRAQGAEGEGDNGVLSAAPDAPAPPPAQAEVWTAAPGAAEGD